MAFCRILLPLLVVSVVQSYAAVEVPVFLWGDLGQPDVRHSALSAVPSNEFRMMLKQELHKKPFVVVFIEETLSVEDLSSKVDGATVFSYLEANIGDALYLPSVESPLRVLNKFADPEKVDHVKLTDSGLSADINRPDGQFLFINLKDAAEGESREDLLRRHNDFMEDMFTKLQEKYDEVVAIYTAHYPSWTVVEHSRVRRQTEESTSGNPAVTDLSFNGLKIYFQSVLLNDKLLTGATASPDSTTSETSMNSTIDFSNAKVTLNIANRDGYWLIDQAHLTLTDPPVEEDLYPSDEGVFALLGFSYRCAVNTTFATKNESNAYTLNFQNIRVQAFFNGNDTNEFGDMFNCVGFFTAPIWAGLFVVACLLAITFYGIMMMMDIRTMDRFDDPKGKTITINASE